MQRVVPSIAPVGSGLRRRSRSDADPGEAGPVSPRPDLRLRAACDAGRAAAALSRRTGRGSGGVIGGRVTLRLAPRAVRDLARGRDVLLVSGTNGKTTTSAMLARALRTAGPVAQNGDGANTPAGFVTALAGPWTPRAVLETDEGWLPWTVWETAPSTVVLLNLSRDQLSRHHEVGRLVAAWRAALEPVDTVVANADDPDVVWPALAAKRQVWVAAGQRWTEDSLVCPRCGGLCERSGSSWSSRCGLRRPDPDWWVEGDELVSRDVRLPLQLPLPGGYNRGNAALAAAAAAVHGIAPAAAVAALREVTTVSGRYAVHEHAGRQVRLLLAKNPAGWLEMVDLVGREDRPVVLAFNSDGVDGRDPSWLYDVSFRALAGRPVVVTGRRATDMQVRLEMDGLGTVAVRPGVLAAVEALPPGPVDVLANYTAFQEARRELRRADG